MKNALIYILLFVYIPFFQSCKKLDEPGSLVAKTVDKDNSLPSININGVQLHSEAFGHPDSAIIIVLHGGPGWDYRNLMNCKSLANHNYRVVFYDQIGSGLSQRFNEKFYTNKGMGVMDMLFDELHGVINHYKTHPNQDIILLGHSWGGMLATAFLGKHPNAAKGLIVIEPGGFKWGDVKTYLSNSMEYNLWDERLNDATFIDQIITAKDNQQEIIDYKMTVFVNLTAPHWRMGASVQYAFREIGDKHSPNFADGIESFIPNVLFIYSEKNKAYTDTWASKISSVFNSVHLEKIQGIGHSGIIANENAWTNQTTPIILDYLNSL